MFSWDVWQIPLLSAAGALLIIAPFAFGPLALREWRLRRQQREWVHSWNEDPVVRFQRELREWDGVLPAWLRIESYGTGPGRGAGTDEA